MECTKNKKTIVFINQKSGNYIKLNKKNIEVKLKNEIIVFNCLKEEVWIFLKPEYIYIKIFEPIIQDLSSFTNNLRNKPLEHKIFLTLYKNEIEMELIKIESNSNKEIKFYDKEIINGNLFIISLLFLGIINQNTLEKTIEDTTFDNKIFVSYFK